jgi:hypothetical protein
MLSDELHCVQSLFMRRLAGGVRKSTPRHLLLREFGCRPLVRLWLQAAVSLWNRMLVAPASGLLRTALQDNMTLHHPKGVTWYASFSELLTTVGGMPQGGLHLGEAPTKLDVADVLQSFDNYACWVLCLLEGPAQRTPHGPH